MTKYGMLIDLRRCAGCGACVVACQMQNNQKPGVSWNNLETCEWGEEIGDSGRAYIPHACMQCDEPACVSVCPTGATFKRDDGITVIDYEKCIACGSCLPACPYGARTISKSNGNMFDAKEPAPYEAYGVQRASVAEKCIFCEARLAEGKLPACTVNCPGRARYFGDLEDPTSPISEFLSKNADSVRIDESSFYYYPVANMPTEALPFAASGAVSDKKEEKPTEKAQAGIDPLVAAGVGGAVVVAAGVGVGVALNNKKKKGEKNA